jgi:PAS domain S-box-containing protein
VGVLSPNERALEENRNTPGKPARLEPGRLAEETSRGSAERRLAEAPRRASEAQFKGLFDRAPIGLALVSTGGKILSANAAVQAILGYDESELRQLTFIDITHADDTALDWSLFQEVLAGTRDSYSMEKRCIRKDGEIVWGHLAVSVTRDERGAPRSIIRMLLDVTERHEAELSRERAKVAAEELALFRQEQADEATAMYAVTAALASTLEPEQLYQIILEQAARILPCDHAGVTLYAQGQATRVATWGEPCLHPGSTWPMTDLWLPDAQSEVTYQPDTDKDPRWKGLPPLVGPFRERSVLSAPLTIDGTLVGSFDVSSRTPGFYSERHLRLAALFANRATDALRNAHLFEAEQQRRHAAEDLVLLRSDFVAAVSHELRTPLTAIIGFGELLLARWDKFSEERRLQRITQIVQAANRQKRLVDDLLLLSQLETSRRGSVRDVLAVHLLLQQAAAELQGSYPGQSIDLCGVDHLCIRADAARVVQIMVNLLDNAAKYSAEGSAVVVSGCQDGERVVLRVRDHGPGIPVEGQELLFTRFGRVPGSRMRDGHVGTGLGLFLGRQLAQSMGGDLELETTGPEGTTFRLRLPTASS